jgi:hypothetical protein
MDLFDAEMATSERMRAGEMMYARCTNPLDFWLEALPTLPPMQVRHYIHPTEGAGRTHSESTKQPVTIYLDKGPLHLGLISCKPVHFQSTQAL